VEADRLPLVLIRYRDHILFRNLDPSGLKPQLRETVGWLAKETPEAVLILWDRGLERLPHGRAENQASGLIILKGDIVELRGVET
jgi:hypothetical protein